MYITKKRARRVRINWVRLIGLAIILVLMVQLGLLIHERNVLREQVAEIEQESSKSIEGESGGGSQIEDLKEEILKLTEENVVLKEENLQLRGELDLMTIQLKEKEAYDAYIIDILARTIYSEAGNQSELGKYAVALVVRNRVKATWSYWPDTYEGVIFQKYQFAGTTHSNFQIDPPEDCVRIATEVYYETENIDFPSNVYYFKTKNCNADWDYKIYKQIGDHVFYYGD